MAGSETAGIAENGGMAEDDVTERGAESVAGVKNVADRNVEPVAGAQDVAEGSAESLTGAQDAEEGDTESVTGAQDAAERDAESVTGAQDAAERSAESVAGTQDATNVTAGTKDGMAGGLADAERAAQGYGDGAGKAKEPEKPPIDAVTAAKVAALEAENERLKASFEPLYTQIGRNFYEKPDGYELEITAAVQKLNEMNGRIHDNYLSTLRLRGIRYCPNCEKIVDDETVFCGDCGTRIDPPEEADEQSVLCGCCGAKNDREKHFCIKCGQRLGPQQAVFRRCPSCGTQLPADARFCEECGTRII